MRKTILTLIVLVAAALIAPVVALGHGRDGTAVRVKIDLPFTVAAPALECPAATFLTVNYRISATGKTGSGTNCILGFNSVACAPMVCSDVPILITLRLPGGTITAQGALFERAPCDPASNAACTTVQHTWSGTVTQATGRFHKLEGATVSGGGVARYRFPADQVEPFAKFSHYVIVIRGV